MPTAIRSASTPMGCLSSPTASKVRRAVGRRARGPRLGSILGFAHIVTAATDTPFLPRDLAARLKRAAEAASVELAAAASGGRAHPVIGLWPCRLADDLRQALGQGTRKVDEWTVRHGVAVADFGQGPQDPFFNVNRPDDLQEAETLLRRSVPCR